MSDEASPSDRSSNRPTGSHATGGWAPIWLRALAAWSHARRVQLEMENPVSAMRGATKASNGLPPSDGHLRGTMVMPT